MGLTYSHRARRRLHPWQPKAAGGKINTERCGLVQGLVV